MWQWCNRFCKQSVGGSRDANLGRARRTLRLSVLGWGIFAVLLLLSSLGAGNQAAAQVTFTQITVTTVNRNDEPSISAGGTKIAFGSNVNLTGDNPDWSSPRRSSTRSSASCTTQGSQGATAGPKSGFKVLSRISPISRS